MTNPSVYYFNPTCELAIANGSFSYMPPLLLQEMEQELSILPFVFANENDFVLTENAPSETFTQTLTRAEFTMPKFLNLSELENIPAQFESVVPWGWSPSTHYKLRRLKEKCVPEFINNPGYSWLPEHRLLFERITSLNLLNKILDSSPPDFIIGRNLAGVKVTEFEEIEQLLKKHSALVIKAPLSSSGRGIQFIRKKTLSQANRQWISGIWKQQNYVIAEPVLEKWTDLSFQFQISADSSLRYMGCSVFETNSNGQYKASLINPDLKKIFSEADVKIVEEMILSTAELLLKALTGTAYQAFHRGFLGVDALVFLNGEDLKIQPCLEINSRMNMGVLSMFIERQIHPEASGKFELYYHPKGNFSDFVALQSNLNPPKFQDGKLLFGFFPLTEALPNTKFGAYISLDGPR